MADEKEYTLKGRRLYPDPRLPGQWVDKNGQPAIFVDGCYGKVDHWWWVRPRQRAVPLIDPSGRGISDDEAIEMILSRQRLKTKYNIVEHQDGSITVGEIIHTGDWVGHLTNGNFIGHNVE